MLFVARNPTRKIAFTAEFNLKKKKKKDDICNGLTSVAVSYSVSFYAETKIWNVQT